MRAATRHEVEHVTPIDVVHTRSEPVFVIGYGSSGTSVFATLLRRYLKISYGTESQFIARYFRRLSRYGRLDDDANLRLLIRDIVSERCFTRWQKFGFFVDADRVFTEVNERTYRGVLDSLFSQLARHNGMTRWGDKTPEDVYHLHVLGRLFPDAQYIHLIRDGRDVALSVFGRYFGAKNSYCAAKVWKDATDRLRSFVKTLPPEQRLEIRYEELLTEPNATFARLIEFLGVEDSRGRLKDWIRENVTHDLKSSNFDKWRAGLTPTQIAVFESVAGDALRAYGYPTQTAQSKPPNLIHRMYWTIDDRFRRWLTPGYWQDQGYRMRVRLRDARRGMQFMLRRTIGTEHS